MASAYILRSLKDGGYCYGSTKDRDSRIKAHNAGKVRATKARRPLELHYSAEFNSVREARQRESFFKSIEGYKWLRKSGIVK